MMSLDTENYATEEYGLEGHHMRTAIVDTDGRVRILPAMYTAKPVVIIYTAEGREFARAMEGDHARINEMFAIQGLPVPYVKK